MNTVSSLPRDVPPAGWPRGLTWPVLGLLGLLLGGCATSHVRFTETIREGAQLTEPELKRIQFFVCAPILLERETSTLEKRFPAGSLVLRNGTRYHQVEVPAWTPGVVVDSAPGKLHVSFAPGTSLPFGLGRDGDGYVVRGRVERGRTLVRYNRHDYRLLPQQPQDCEGTKLAQPTLWITRDASTQVERSRETLSGRRVSQRD
ncbi:MAG: hypothetical protein RBU45_22200 [Myxococcota bacterium]|jgi:hypothetical protein|nr:hypothetical protein [Myxococcota bacterium]